MYNCCLRSKTAFLLSSALWRRFNHQLQMVLCSLCDHSWDQTFLYKLCFSWIKISQEDMLELSILFSCNMKFLLIFLLRFLHLSHSPSSSHVSIPFFPLIISTKRSCFHLSLMVCCWVCQPGGWFDGCRSLTFKTLQDTTFFQHFCLIHDLSVNKAP